jgi:ferric-dicitrate binding protein FerR (iron transport regulator)
MTLELLNHLSEESLNDVLIGLPAAASEAHIEQCAECRARVEDFQSSVRLFNQASLAWIDAQPGRTLPAARPFRSARRRLMLAAWATAAALFVMAGVPFLRHPIQMQSPAMTAPTDSEEQIAEDNELLRAVDAAINPDEQSVVNSYQLESRPPKHPQR